MKLTMTRARMVVATAAVTSIGLGLAAGPAFAAAPSNDAYADRSPLTAGSTVSVDTREATTEAIDAEAGSRCTIGTPPAVTNTVWFDYTADAAPPAFVQVQANITGAAGVLVVTGEPGSFTGVACGPFA